MLHNRVIISNRSVDMIVHPFITNLLDSGNARYYSVTDDQMRRRLQSIQIPKRCRSVGNGHSAMRTHL